MTLNPARWRIGRKTARITALAALLLLAGVCLYRQFGPSPLEPCANDPALVNRIIRETAKAAEAINSGRGRGTYYEWNRWSDGSTQEARTDFSVSFLGDRFVLREKDIYSRATQVHAPLPDRLSRAWKRLLNPRYSNSACDESVVSYDGKHTIVYRPSVRKAYVYPADCVFRGSSSVVPGMPREAVVIGQGGARQREGYGPWRVEVTQQEPVVVGWQSLDGLRCLVVEQRRTARLASHQSSNTCRFWVCPTRGYSILRAETRSRDGTRLLLRWDVTVRRHQGRWVPVRDETLWYGDCGKDLYGVVHRRVSTLESGFQFNLPAHKLHLSLRLPRGTKVHDEVRKRDYVVK